MSNLTYLNDATVLWNLKDRYYTKLIYVRLSYPPSLLHHTSEIAVFRLIQFGTLSTRFLKLLLQEMGSIYHIESYQISCLLYTSDAADE